MKHLFYLMLALFIISCGNSQQAKPVQQEPVQKTEEKNAEKVVVKEVKDTEPKIQTDIYAEKVPAQNKQLEKASLEQFKLGSAVIPPHQYAQWAKKAAPIVKNIINMLPEGYVLEISGHTDTVGTDSANEKLSNDRALAVYNSLLKQGIKSKKLIYKGVGTSQLLSGVKDTDARQRRVSFKVVKQ